MGKDYYATLGITREATDAHIKKAYRKLALKWHPVKNKDLGAEDRSKEIAEAYDVLSNPSHKAVYDKFGEEGLKGGIPDSDSGASKGYAFHGDSYKVFHEFFGGDNPFSDFFHLEKNLDVDGHATFGGLQGRAQPKQDPPVERELFLTLEELYKGCTKKMKISRKVLNEDGWTTSMREKIVTITVKPGWKQDSRITFPKEGDQGISRIPADVVFIVKDHPHPHFHREGSNLVYQPQISLLMALTGGSIEIPTLDGRVVRVAITEVISPGHEARIVGEGMPLAENPNKRGDLLVRYSIKFPTTLHSQQKALIKQALH